MFEAIQQGDPRLHDVIQHHENEFIKAVAHREALVRRARRMARLAGVNVTVADLEAKTNNQLNIIIQAAEVAAYV